MSDIFAIDRQNLSIVRPSINGCWRKGKSLEPFLFWTKGISEMANKNIRFTVRFSDEELNEVERKAKQMKMTTSRFIRTMAVDGQATMLEVPEYTKVIVELTKIGTNLNQITRRLNEQGSFYYEEMSEIKEEHEKICHMLNQYLSTLRLTKL